MKTIRKLLENRIIFHLISMLIPMVLMGVICLLMRIAPFGDHSFLIADMQKQYIDFFAYYKELLHGGHGIFYTFGKCLGGDMFGFFTYYLTSPLNLLFLFVPFSALPDAITILILIKMGLCGLTMSIYLRSHFSWKTDWLPELYIFSTGYAMMSFLMVNSFNVMWHEPIILLPLILLGLESLILQQKYKLYIVSLAGALFCNYYISYMICIFCVCYFVGMLFLHWDRSKAGSRICRFVTSSLLSGGICAVFLLPTFFTIGGSLKDEKAVAIGITHANVTPLQVLSKLFTFSFSANELMGGMPNLFCGLIIVILVSVYFFHEKIALREKLVYLGLFCVLMLSFCNAKLDYVWHAFMEPSGYPFRYSFIFSFLLLVLACKGFLTLYEYGFSIKTFLLSALSFLILFALTYRKNYEYINKNYEFLDLVLFVVIWIIFFTLFGKKDNWQPTNKWLGITLMTSLIIIQLGNLTFSNLFIYRSLRNTSYLKISDYEALYQPITEAIDALRNEDDSFYRMENLNRSTLNNSMHYAYAGLSHYSSNEQFFVLHFLQKMGLNYNHLYLEYGQGATATLDSLLGVKYLLANNNSINKPYEKFISASSENGLNVYKNPYALPIAFMVDNGIADESFSASFSNETNPFEMQEHIYKSLINSTAIKDENIFENAIVSTKATDSGKIYQLEAKHDGYLYMYADADDILPAGAIKLNGEVVSDYYDLHRWCIINLGYFEAGAQCEVELTCDTPEQMKEAYFESENTDILGKFHQAIMNISDVSIRKISNSHLQMTAAGDGDHQSMLLLTIPYEENWHIKIDGQKASAVKVFDTLTAIPLEPGEHLIEMCYVPRGFLLGLCISIISLIITKKHRTVNC